MNLHQSGSRVLMETVHSRLHDAIMKAELKPNSRLVEKELAEWLGVSRTPIREALLCLEQEGHVERKRGWIVREHEPTDIKERLECRLAIEGYAARLAALRRTPDQLIIHRDLESSMLAKNTTIQTFNELNTVFHQTITEAAANPMLGDFHAQTRMNYWDLSFPVVFSAQDNDSITAQHHNLLDALEKMDGDRAELIAREHVQLTMRVIGAELELRYGNFKP